jgi:hypothetical protein
VPTFVDRGVSRWLCGGTLTAVKLSFLDRSRYFYFKQLLIYAHEDEWTPFQTHCYSKNLGAPGIEPWTAASAARNSDHETAEAVSFKDYSNIIKYLYSELTQV